MTIKTITITEDAYNKIKSLKHNDESFSDLFRRLAENRSSAGKEFFGIFKASSEEMVKKRKHFKKIREEMSKNFKN